MTLTNAVWICLAALIVLIGFSVRTRLRRPDRIGWEVVMKTHGAARCRLVVQIIHNQFLVGTFDEHRCAEYWNHIELPLVEALPDCPPDLKPVMREACDAFVQRVRNREFAKRIMAVRNSLIPV